MAARWVHSTYRGIPVPKPQGNQKNPYSYVINDGRYGYFMGTLDGVIQAWERAVDDSLTNDALAGDYTTHPIGMPSPLLCRRCGAMVGDIDAHDRWHLSQFDD